jgi:cytoskeletal protein CcmA (bactofilin family)
MAKDRGVKPSPPEQVISIIGPGMRITGDCDTDGSVRVEGLITGTIRAGKSVVLGKDGVVEGDILTQDAVISGKIKWTHRAYYRLEVQSTSRIDGEVLAGRMQLEEGAVLNGTIQMGKGVGSEPAAKKEISPPQGIPGGPERGVGSQPSAKVEGSLPQGNPGVHQRGV